MLWKILLSVETFLGILRIFFTTIYYLIFSFFFYYFNFSSLIETSWIFLFPKHSYVAFSFHPLYVFYAYLVQTALGSHVADKIVSSISSIQSQLISAWFFYYFRKRLMLQQTFLNRERLWTKNYAENYVTGA